MERSNALFAATRTYFREVFGELSKVVWPSKERTLQLTGIVVAMVAVLTAFLFLLDIPLGWALQKFLGK